MNQVITPTAARKGGKVYDLLALEQTPTLDVFETAALLRIAPDTVRRAIREGELKAENYGTAGRPTYRIPRAYRLEWQEARRVTVTK